MLQHPVHRAAHMQYDRQAVLACKLQLRTEKMLLLFEQWALRKFRHKKIQPDFTDRDEARVLLVQRQLFVQCSEVLRGGVGHIQGVNAQAVAVTKLLGQGAHRCKVGHFNCRNNAMRYTFDSCLRTYCGRQQLIWQVKFGRIEMAVGVDPAHWLQRFTATSSAPTPGGVAGCSAPPGWHRGSPAQRRCPGRAPTAA